MTHREIADPDRLKRGDLLANEHENLYPVLNKLPSGDFDVWNGRERMTIPASFVRDAKYYYVGKVSETFLQAIEEHINKSE